MNIGRMLYQQPVVGVEKGVSVCVTVWVAGWVCCLKPGSQTLVSAGFSSWCGAGFTCAHVVVHEYWFMSGGPYADL